MWGILSSLWATGFCFCTYGFENTLCALLPHRDICDRETGELYLRRFYLTPRIFGRRIFLHHIVRSDKDRDLHDHPWNFVTVILRYGYWETLNGIVWAFHRPLSVLRRQSEDAHRITLAARRNQKGAWTLVFVGKRQRRWGFHTPDGWVYWRDYLGVSEGDDHD
jgi:hypothetical protein